MKRLRATQSSTVSSVRRTRQPTPSGSSSFGGPLFELASREPFSFRHSKRDHIARKPAEPAHGGLESHVEVHSCQAQRACGSFQGRPPAPGARPGRHAVWSRRVTEQRWSTDALVFQALPEVRAVLPADWFREVTIGRASAASCTATGSPKGSFVRERTVSGRSTLRSTCRCSRCDARCRSSAPSSRRSSRSDEYVDVLVREFERGLQYVQGRLVRTLGPGRYTLWSPGRARQRRRRRHASCAGRHRRSGADDPRQGDAASLAHGRIRRGGRGARGARRRRA